MKILNVRNPEKNSSDYSGGIKYRTVKPRRVHRAGAREAKFWLSEKRFLRACGEGGRGHWKGIGERSSRALVGHWWALVGIGGHWRGSVDPRVTRCPGVAAGRKTNFAPPALGFRRHAPFSNSGMRTLITNGRTTKNLG